MFSLTISLLPKRFFRVSRQSTTATSTIMSKTHPPELKKYMDKRVSIKINGGRQVAGILRGFDPFMNIVVDETYEVSKSGERAPIGMVVIRGNSIVLMEAQERI